LLPRGILAARTPLSGKTSATFSESSTDGTPSSPPNALILAPAGDSEMSNVLMVSVRLSSGTVLPSLHAAYTIATIASATPVRAIERPPDA
jgi:hypothetical protein